MTELPEVPYEADEDPMARDQGKRREGEKVQSDTPGGEEPQVNHILFVFPQGMAEPAQTQLNASPGQMARAVSILQEAIGLSTRSMLTELMKAEEAKRPRIMVPGRE